MEIKDRILAKAEELYFKYGVKSVTMDDIAQELGISKKTIYVHFPDKRKLVKHVMMMGMDKEIHKCIAVTSQYEDPLEEIMASVEMIREMYANTNFSLLYDLQKYYPEAWQYYLDQKQQFRSIIKNNLIRGIETGVFRDDFDPEILATLRLESIDMAFNPDIYSPKEFDSLSVQLTFIDHFIRGIVTEKGLKGYLELKERK